MPVLMLLAAAVCDNPAPPWPTLNMTDVQAAAKRGDQEAQFELGQRYRLGSGVARDLSRARKWYARAARSTESRLFIYSGPVGSESHGRAIGTGHADIRLGLPKADACLRSLERQP